MNDTDDQIIELQNMKKLAAEFIQSGGKIIKLPAYATTIQQTVIDEDAGQEDRLRWSLILLRRRRAKLVDPKDLQRPRNQFCV
jgi:hypothetical protein